MLTQELLTSFKNEALAEEAFRGMRLRKGITCKKCSGRQHYWLASKKQFQCKSCRFRTTLQSGTILQGSKLPLSYFFIALQMFKENGRHISVDEFQRETGHKYYDPLWDFVRKLKDYVDRNEPEILEKDFSEVVKTYFVARKNQS